MQNSKAIIEHVTFSFFKLTVNTTGEIYELHILPLYVVIFVLIVYAIEFVVAYVKHRMAEDKAHTSSYKD